MGCSISKAHDTIPAPPEEAAASDATRSSSSTHKAIPQLMKLDDRLEAALQSVAIKLIDATFLRDEKVLARLERRQELEAREAREGIKIFLTPDEAVGQLRESRRSIGSLTYGWGCPDHPDPSGEYLAAVRRFLRSEHGAHIQACFWE